MQLSLLEIEPVTPMTPSWLDNMLAALGVQRSENWPDRFGMMLQQWLARQTIPQTRTLSLFSGGGGLDIAFHDAGFHIVEMVEIDPRYAETLKRNFAKHVKVTCIDIHDYVPDHTLQVDFIIGGPPCQTFSAAGRRAAGVAGMDDPRGTLFQEYIRLLLHLRPKGFLFENVYGITGAQDGRAWKEIQKAFQEAGYRIFYRVIDAADYGVPQHRERLFIVGLQEGEFLFPYPTHGPDSIDQEPYHPAGEAVKGADITNAPQGIGGKYGHLLNDIPPGLNYSFYTKEMGHPMPVFSWRSKFSDFLYKADPERPVRTIKAQGGQYTGPFSWENRVFTVAELKRLQTFPGTYEIVGGRQVCIEQIGNSVPPQVGRMLAISILDQVFKVSLPFAMHYLPANKELGFRQRKRLLSELYSEKARSALDQLQPSNHRINVYSSPEAGAESTIRFMGNNFSWTNVKTLGSEEFSVMFAKTREDWHISVNQKLVSQGSGKDLNNKSMEFYIDVRPSPDGQWPLGVESVRLQACTLDPKSLTALWKAFEEKIVEITGMADLVQLSGYYQYKSQIKAKLFLAGSATVEPFWNILKLVTEGVGVGKQLSSEQISTVWGCEIDNLFEYLLCLKELGFEVRGHTTNSQIKSGEYLIPYIFPTFTPKSVQLKKNLRKPNV